mgnify:CR=1 FL=1
MPCSMASIKGSQTGLKKIDEVYEPESFEEEQIVDDETFLGSEIGIDLFSTYLCQALVVG